MTELLHALLRNAEQRGAETAFADDDAALSWEQLAERVGGALTALDERKETIGIAGGNGTEWVVAFLAAWLAGKTIVPIPTFFSAGQVARLVADAGVQRIIATDTAALRMCKTTVPNLPTITLPEARAPLSAQPARCNGGLIIHTSGSTGRPKGVRLEHGQPLWTARTLAQAVGANARDRYLSLLPLPMLLEIICAIFIPVLVGGSTFLARQVAQAVPEGRPVDLLSLFDQVRPSRSVMVPQLLALYARQLAQAGRTVPDSLTFVAVGGAPVPAAVASLARQVGIPFFVGYGLSECGSVVSLNLPEAARDGSAGRPLPGLRVEIEAGEIVVSGPPLMDGYTLGDRTLDDCSNGATAPQRWRTGDLGRLDKNGFLHVLGRKDNLLVTAAGRNITPEWIESMVQGDARLHACVLTLSPAHAGPGMLVIPTRQGEAWLQPDAREELLRLLQRACASAPAHARPQWVETVSPEQALQAGLLRADGSVNRAAVRAFIARRHASVPEKEHQHDAI